MGKPNFHPSLLILVVEKFNLSLRSTVILQCLFRQALERLGKSRHLFLLHLLNTFINILWDSQPQPTCARTDSKLPSLWRLNNVILQELSLFVFNDHFIDPFCADVMIMSGKTKKKLEATRSSRLHNRPKTSYRCVFG